MIASQGKSCLLLVAAQHRSALSDSSYRRDLDRPVARLSGPQNQSERKTRAVARLVKLHGFASESFAKAEAFLDYGSRGGVACLVLDIHLGSMSGIDLGRRLKALGSDIPIIFITAVDDEATREAMSAGCVAHLRKPFRSRVLIDAINRAVA